MSDSAPVTGVLRGAFVVLAVQPRPQRRLEAFFVQFFFGGTVFKDFVYLNEHPEGLKVSSALLQ